MLDITGKNALLVLKKYLEENDRKKFEHSIRVAQIGKMLAEKWNVSKEDTIIACLLHDIGKSLSRMEMLELCTRSGIILYDFEIFDNIGALHGKVGSLLFEKEFDRNDSERFNRISHAISFHIAGDETITELDKIVFIADNVEPEKGNDLLSRIQADEFREPNECIIRIIKDKRDRASREERELNPMFDCTLKAIEDEER